jgi:HEAT repeat protein
MSGVMLGAVGATESISITASSRIAAEAGTIRAQGLRTIAEHLDALWWENDEWVRRAVVTRLERVGRGDERMLPALIGALATDQSPLVRVAAAVALEPHLDDRRAANALARGLLDEDEAVRSAARHALAAPAA